MFSVFVDFSKWSEPYLGATGEFWKVIKYMKKKIGQNSIYAYFISPGNEIGIPRLTIQNIILKMML